MFRRNFMKTALAASLTSTAVSNPVTTKASSVKSNKKPRIMFYNDCRHPGIYMYEPPMEKEELEKLEKEIG